MTILRFPKSFFYIALFVVFIFLPAIVALVTDWWWFLEVGYGSVFLKSLGAKLTLALIAGIFAATFLFTNFSVALRSGIPSMIVVPESLFGKRVVLDSRAVKKSVITATLAIAIFSGLVASANWQEVLKFISGTAFGAVDPIFSKDIGFYIFSLPFVQAMLGLAKILIVLTAAGCGLIYFLRGNLNFSGLSMQTSMQSLKQLQVDRTASPARSFISNGARVHLGILLVAFLASVIAGIYISLFTLLIEESGPVFGAAFTDVSVGVPILWMKMVAASLMLIAAVYWMWKEILRPLIWAIILYFLLGVVSTVVPSLVQKLIVAPNELVKETPFIKHNINATREAYALDKIEEREISGDKPITSADIRANSLTVKNVRLWDRQPLLSTFSQIQEIRTYYEFVQVDNDRYVIDGEIRQIMLSPREMASASLPNRNWINERLTFTHGYGVAAGPVNQVTPEGLPVLFVKDLPPKSDVKELEITRPEIYFGELSNDYVIAKTKSREFDYPKGEENVYATYEGNGGVEMNSFIRRVFYAVKFKSLKILLSNDITRESRIMYHRTISSRVAKVAPFLTLDRDPYSVIADGKVYWIVDAYTTSDNYPYSQPVRFDGKNVNYIRNSVKIVIDAYDGNMAFYQADEKDPIIKTYAKIFPGLFKSLSKMPESLTSHLRYPEDIFTLQTSVYSVYHMDDPQIFYNKEDQWDIPAIASEGGGVSSGKVSSMQPRHVIMKLPGEKKEEYVLMLPFTPRAKDNLSAWMVARNDGEHYGKLLVYSFPKDKLVFGPKQIIGRINQDPEISQQISLWSQGGSQVIQGPLLVIPVEESLLYVRSLYLKAETGKIPELKRVIVAYENKIAMEETLEEGLARIFGLPAPRIRQAGSGVGIKPQVIPSQDIRERIQEAAIAYEEALRAQRDGEWARYGEAIRRLGEILRQ